MEQEKETEEKYIVPESLIRIGDIEVSGTFVSIQTLLKIICKLLNKKEVKEYLSVVDINKKKSMLSGGSYG